MILVEEYGRDTGWDLDSAGQPACGEFCRSRVFVASDREAAQVHSCLQNPPEQWAYGHRKDDVPFFTGSLLVLGSNPLPM